MELGKEELKGIQEFYNINFSMCNQYNTNDPVYRKGSGPFDEQELYNDFIEHNLLQLGNEEKEDYKITKTQQQLQQQQQQQQENLQHDQKIQQLQNGIGYMKEIMDKYEEQLKQIEQINQCKQFSQQVQNMSKNRKEEEEEEVKIECLKIQVKSERKLIKKKKQKVFRCKEADCSFESHKKIEVSRHVRKCHNYFGIQSQYSCKFCQQKFHIDEARIRHEKVNHPQQMVKISQNNNENATPNLEIQDDDNSLQKNNDNNANNSLFLDQEVCQNQNYISSNLLSNLLQRGESTIDYRDDFLFSL